MNFNDTVKGSALEGFYPAGWDFVKIDACVGAPESICDRQAYWHPAFTPVQCESLSDFETYMGHEIAMTPWMQDIDIVIPVPLHWRRKWTRGYNQAEIIGAEVASVLGAQLRTDILKRKRHTKTQTKLDISEKASNVKGAFQAAETTIEGIRHVLLIDDVFTSGNTLGECFMALREVFPTDVRISVATLGFILR